MNKQDRGKGKRGIGWTDYTWNPVAGCKHACRWTMPDGTTARCYAEAVAEGVARAAYPWGFDHHYWLPGRLQEPLKLKEPARIFLDSMADLMGRWVPDDQIRAVFDICRQAHWHDFQLLTKNAPRLLKFADEIPANVWVGVSVAPSSMWGVDLGEKQRTRWMNRALEVLQELYMNHRRPRVLWMSLEPLSFDVLPFFNEFDADFLDWLVIGAASNGAKTYQPDPDHVQNIITWATIRNTPLFFKSNLEWTFRAEEMPRRYEPAQAKGGTWVQIELPTEAAERLAEMARQSRDTKTALTERIVAELTPTGPIHRDQVFTRLGCERDEFDLALRALVSLDKVEDDGNNGLTLIDPTKDQQQPVTEALTDTILDVLRDKGPTEYPHLRNLVRVRAGVLYDTMFFSTVLERLVKQGKVVKEKSWTYKLAQSAAPHPSFDEVAIRAMIRRRLEERAGLAA